MKYHHPHARRRRARGALVVIALFMGILVFSFFRVQVLRSDTYALESESNRLRPVPVPAPRGTIYDRNGRILADNVTGYQVSILPAPLDSIRARLERLRSVIPMDDRRIERLMAGAARYRREPVVVTTNADFGRISTLEERRDEFPGVFVEMRPRRRYVAGPATAHVLGYIGEITTPELESAAYKGYQQGMIVGKGGIERQYEDLLQGEQGLRFLEVDARGRIVGSYQTAAEQPARPGGDLRLNIDLELQEWIHRIFPDDMMGAVVALDPADGGVLALYSSPTYDPNAFVGGVDPRLWQWLNTYEKKPLLNRAVNGLYPPGSTFKLATAAVGLETGAITPETRMPVPCTGGMYYGGQYRRCWNASGHGSLSLVDAIRHSCNVYFYQVGLRVGLDRYLERMSHMGFNRQTDIDLPEERAGIFPGGREYWERTFGYTPNPGEVISLSIGQGPNSQTPLKLAQLYVAMANEGRAPPPRIFTGAEDPDEGWAMEIDEPALEALREGLRRVVMPGGTAFTGASLEYWDAMGKTGTAENTLSKQGLADDHAWFVGMFGPLDGDAEIVVAAMVEFGGGGSRVAAPIAAKTADFYLRRNYGIPVDTIQIFREYGPAGRSVEWAFERQGR